MDPVTIRARTLWLAAAIAVGIAIGWFVLAHALDSFLLIFTAIVLAEGLRPLVHWLSRGPLSLPRPLAVLLLYGAVLAGFVALGWLIVRPLTLQIATLVDNLPQYIAEAQHLLAQAEQFVRHNSQATSLLQALSSQAGRIAQQSLPLVLRAPFLLANLLFGLIQILLLCFFWLTAIDGLTGFVVGLLPAPA